MGRRRRRNTDHLAEPPPRSDLHVRFFYRLLAEAVQRVLGVLPRRGQVLQLVAAAAIGWADVAGRRFVLPDLLQLVAGVLRLGGEGARGNLQTQDVRDHVRPEPADQRGAAGGVVGLPVVEEEPVHLQGGGGGGGETNAG